MLHFTPPPPPRPPPHLPNPLTQQPARIGNRHDTILFMI